MLFIFVADSTGLIHLVTASLALISGTAVLVTTKGTTRHKQLGYVYTLSMVVMLITSFMIYRLFGGFGIFHLFSVISTLTLAGGIIPALLRKPDDTWIAYHFSFMYWSVIGLYAAFVSEVFTRVPDSPFFGMLGLAMFFVFTAGYFFWNRYQKKWWGQFGKKEVRTEE